MSKPNVIGKTKALQNAQTPPATYWQPTKGLNPEATEHFVTLIESRATFDWGKSDMIVLTRLADWLAQADALQRRLKLEGLTAVNERGTQIVNPLFSVLDVLERRIMTAFSKLNIFQISLAQKALAPAARNKKQAGIAGEGATDNDDDLLA